MWQVRRTILVFQILRLVQMDIQRNVFGEFLNFMQIHIWNTDSGKTKLKYGFYRG